MERPTDRERAYHRREPSDTGADAVVFQVRLYPAGTPFDPAAVLPLEHGVDGEGVGTVRNLRVVGDWVIADAEIPPDAAARLGLVDP